MRAFSFFPCILCLREKAEYEEMVQKYARNWIVSFFHIYQELEDAEWTAAEHLYVHILSKVNKLPNCGFMFIN